jgi:hypothetical protein
MVRHGSFFNRPVYGRPLHAGCPGDLEDARRGIRLSACWPRRGGDPALFAAGIIYCPPMSSLAPSDLGSRSAPSPDAAKGPISKSTDTESGAAAIKPHLALDAVVLSLQNGGGFKIPWRGTTAVRREWYRSFKQPL